MAKEEVIYQQFSGGELSPQMRGRADLAIYKSGCRRARNMISETLGNSRYRNGLRKVHHTRLNQTAFPIEFQFNDEQAYTLEFTDKKLRFYKDDGIILEDDIAISAISKTNPGVVTTTAAHGLADGDEVFLYDIKGMTELNGRSFLINVTGATTFELQDIDAVNVSTINYGTHTATTGVVNRIYELATPYKEDFDLSLLSPTQNADTMYIDHPFYEPRVLTRTGHTSWTLALYTRTSDPFLSKKNISAITLANPGVITFTGAHGYSTGDVIIIEGIVGTTELNSDVYKVVVTAADKITLKNYFTGAAIDTTSYTAWSSGGYASLQELLPSTPCLHEGRLFHGGMEGNPTQFIGSRSPVPTTGVPRLTDYTAGADADHAVYYSIADGEVNHIQWLIGTNRLLMAGTFGTEVKITGETIDKPITPTSINVKAENRLGVAPIAPINKENIVIYVQRNGLVLRSFEFDALNDRFVSNDKNLVAEHITTGGIKQIFWQTGRPDICWAIRNDGVFLGLTFNSAENVYGWHQHSVGGSSSDKVLYGVSAPRPNGYDRAWFVTERVIDGVTRRFMEYMEDQVIFPDFDDFYTGEDNETEDRERFVLAMQEAQKTSLHLDCALSYYGTDIGESAAATLTPNDVTGSIVITSNVNIFVAEYVGREIWKKSTTTGEGYGRARIDAFTDAKHVTCTVLSDFDSVSAMAPGDWYLTVQDITNVNHLEGETISVVADGAVHPDVTVLNGAISLEYQASVVHLGFSYEGILQTMSVEAGGTTGSSLGKPKNINKVQIRFLNTAGAEYGTSLYHPELVDFAEMPLSVGAAQVLFSGVKDLPLRDNWEIDKSVYVRQTNPLPCVVQFLEISVDTDNNGT